VAPVAQSQSVTTNEDVAVPVTLAATDVNGDAVTYAIASSPAHGTLTGTPPNVTYTPALHYFGADSFTFTANDGQLTSSAATVSITVNHVNHPPVANSQSVTTAENTAKAITLTATDIDTGDTLTYAVATQPSHGTVTGTPPNVTYTPATNYVGSDAFTFTANDGQATSNIATVSITITAVNQPPTFTSGGDVSSPEDTAYSAQWATNVSAGPPNESGQTVQFHVTSNSNPGLFATGPDISPAGVLSYSPTPDANGAASITVTLQDNGGGNDTSAPVTFTITVTPVNDPPVFTSGGDVTVLVDSGAYSQPWATGISAGPPDEASQTLTFHVTANSNPSLFSAQPAITSDGTLSFTTASGASGTSSITVTLQDNGGGNDTSAPATFTIRLNHAPVASALTYTVNENDPPLTITLVYSDADGDALTVGVSNPNFGSLSGDGHPTLTYTQYGDQFGTDSFQYTVTDPYGASVTQTVTINITHVNQPPHVFPVTVTTEDDSPVGVNMSQTYDPDGDPMTFTIVTPPAHGTVTGTGPHYIYTPGAAGPYADSFDVKASDPSNAFNVATMTVNVVPAIPQGTEPEIAASASTTDRERSPSIAMDGSGNFVVAWDNNNSGTESVMAQRYVADGTKVGPAFTVATSLLSNTTPRVSMSATG